MGEGPFKPNKFVPTRPIIDIIGYWTCIYIESFVFIRF